MLKKFLSFTALAAVCLNGLAQDTAAENNFTKTAIDSAVANYYHFTDKRSRLLHGLEYTGYTRIEGHAYFVDDKWQSGSVVYDGLTYTNVQMQYDLLKDYLVVLHPDGYPAFRLFTEKVKEFTLAGHHFIHIEHDSLAKMPLATGFYDEMYNQQLMVLVKRTKLIDERVSEKLERSFFAKNYYYVRKDGTFHNVKSYNDLLFLLKDHAKEVKQYLRKNKIKYRKDKETAIVTAVSYYDSL